MPTVNCVSQEIVQSPTELTVDAIIRSSPISKSRPSHMLILMRFSAIRMGTNSVDNDEISKTDVFVWNGLEAECDSEGFANGPYKKKTYWGLDNSLITEYSVKLRGIETPISYTTKFYLLDASTLTVEIRVYDIHVRRVYDKLYL
jgi:hypothetical protein